VIAAVRGRSWRFWTLAGGVVAAVLATGLALIVAAPWSSSGDRPIRHALFRYVDFAHPRLPPLRVELATGRSVPQKLTDEIWLDERTGLYRLKLRIGSDVLFDGVGTSCSPGRPKNGCLRFGIPPFSEADNYQYAVEHGKTREVGKGNVDGHEVVWIARVYRGKTNVRERAALDKQTHELRAVQQLEKGRPAEEESVTLLDDLPTGSVRFPVPRGGAPWASVPPVLQIAMELGSATIRVARGTLSPPPLWVGRHFSGFSLKGIRAGAEKVKGVSGVTLAAVPYVRLDYRRGPQGRLVLEEFNSTSDALLRNQAFFVAPAAGYLLLDQGQRNGTFGRGGVVVRISAPSRKVAVETARAVRSIPAAL
jgi:hypothetical protein